MKILKTLGIILLALVGLILVLGLIAPRKMEAERSLTIDAPPRLVYNTVSDLRTWEFWSPWKEQDATIQPVLADTAVGAGASFTWTSKKSGAGKVTILSAEPDQRLDIETAFDGQGVAHTPFAFEPDGNGAKVTWSFSADMPYPFNAMLLFTGSRAIDKDFGRGLELLKAYVEKQAAEAASARYNGYEVKQIDLPERHFAAVREVISMDQISATYARNLPLIVNALKTKGASMTGMPCGLYFSWDQAAGKSDMASAIPVGQPVDLGGAFVSISLPAGKGLLVDYYGDYPGIEAAHTAIDLFVAATGARVGFPVVEEYVTDPGAEPDPKKWLTRVYYPVQ